MNEALEYTKEYFASLGRLIDKRPHKCRQCGVADGARKINKDGSRQKFPMIVRLCIIDPAKPANRADNVAFYCTRCRKPTEVWRTPRRIKPKDLAQLF